MPESHPAFRVDDVLVRNACVDDHSAIRALFLEGMEEGHIRFNDTGADIDQFATAYLSDEGRSSFWVCEFKGQVIGMIGVQRTAEDTAEIRRLRVKNEYRRQGIGSMLLQKAVHFCKHHGYLKVVLDVRVERGPAISLFEKFGFQHARTREIDGKKLLDFYINIYRDPRTST